MPSCPRSGPTAVSQAERITRSASSRSCTISEACKNPSSPARRSLNRTKAARSGNVESAYGIASLLNNLFGRGKEPFWQQAYTNLVKFIILLHKVNYDYVTLFDVYECAINPDKLELKIKEGERLFQTKEYVLVPDGEYIARRELVKFGFDRDTSTGEMKAAISVELLRHLDQNHIPYSMVTETGGAATAPTPHLARKREQFEAVKRWFYHDWRRIEPKLRTSIVEGISVFLSLFDDNPSVKATFCPPKECYDPELNHDGRYGIPMPLFSQLLA